MCGVTHIDREYEYYNFWEVKDVYEIHGMKDVCNDCGYKLSGFINYYGRKKTEDLAALKSAMNTGVLVQRKFNQQMYGGYDNEFRTNIN